MAGPNQLVGKHYNTGPFGAPKWWSSDAPDGELLYIVHAIIDAWSPEKAERYAGRGYVHYHELVKVSDETLHPTKVVWLKHTARTFFNLDGGPHPEFAHFVTQGVDFELYPTGVRLTHSRKIRQQISFPLFLIKAKICAQADSIIMGF